MNSEQHILLLQHTCSGSSVEELSRSTDLLRQEVNRSGLGKAEMAKASDFNLDLTSLEDGTTVKSDPASMAVIGSLVVATVSASVPGLIALLSTWLTRRKDQTLKITVDNVSFDVPRGTNQDEIDELVRPLMEIIAKTKENKDS